MNFAKRCCADDANLCEIVSVAPDKEGKSQEFINELLRNNRFEVRYREQLEKTSATGTVGAYIYLENAKYFRNPLTKKVTVKGGTVKVNYVDADCIIPLTVENKLVTECAFCATNIVKGKKRTTLVIFTKTDGMYSAETVIFDEFGKVVEAENIALQLGDVKPFAIMTTAEVNNIDDMLGYGLPKIYNSIIFFKVLDLCFNVLYSDLSKADKIVLINELLSEVKDKNGVPTLTKQQKEIFVLLGEALPDQKSLIQEYNPKIRIEEITKAFELVLSLLSLSFGYGSKKYTFENGQIKTATEYIGTKNDAMQELNKQRKQAVDYITDIIHAAMWFSNTFNKTSYDVKEKLVVEFDDSVIIDRETQLESMRADAMSFPEVPWFLFMYIKTKYNLSDEEAEKKIKEGQMSEEPVDDIED